MNTPFPKFRLTWIKDQNQKVVNIENEGNKCQCSKVFPFFHKKIITIRILSQGRDLTTFLNIIDSESDIDSSSEDGMDDPNGRGNGVKLGSSSSDRSAERRVRKKPGHPNRDRGAPKQNLAKAVAAPMVPKILPPPPPPSTRSERLPSTESDKGLYFMNFSFTQAMWALKFFDTFNESP